VEGMYDGVIPILRERTEHISILTWFSTLFLHRYGSVFAARKRDTGKLYAVKCMDKRLIKVRRATRLVVMERQILSSVESPFVTGLKYAFHNAQVRVSVLPPGVRHDSVLTLPTL